MSTAGRPDVIDAIVREATRQVKRIARKFSMPADEAADFLQDVLLGAWKYDVAKYDPGRDALSGFVSRRVEWALQDRRRAYARDQKRRTVAAGEFVGGYGYIHVDHLDHQAIWSRARREARAMRVEGEVCRIVKDRRDRFALVATMLRGETLAEAGRTLGVHPSNVMRARDRAAEAVRCSADREFWTEA